MSFDRSNIDVEDFLECLEIRNVSKATEKEWRFSCPYPNHLNGDENASAYINDHSAQFYCHGCKERGDAVALTSFLLEVSHLEAIRMLRERYQPGFLNPDARSMVEEVRKVLEREDESPAFNVPFTTEIEALEDMAVDWETVDKHRRFAPPELRYMLDRGYEWHVLEEFEFGYDSKTDRITFPVHDEQGCLIGIKGRAWQKGREPKYLVLGDVPEKPKRYGFPRYQTGLSVFNLHRAIEINDAYVEEGGTRQVVICEGELNAVACYQAGFGYTVAVNGSNFTRYQQHMIVKNFDHAIVFFDDDAAGETGTWGRTDERGEHHPGVVDKLKDYMTVSVVTGHDGDPGDMIQQGRAEDLADCINFAQSATRLAIARAA